MSAISSCSGPSPAGGAARPTPGAARTVSIMSSISFWMEASIFLTFLAFLRSTGSGAQRIGRTANDASCPLPDSADAPTGLGATRRSCGRLRLCLGLLFDSGGLSGEAPQVVEPGPTHLAGADDLHLLQSRRVEQEGPLHADPMGDAANG